jgi:hypothetical protein
MAEPCLMDVYNSVTFPSYAEAAARNSMMSNRRSYYGTKCVQCENELIAPERSAYLREGVIRHQWHCPLKSGATPHSYRSH